MPHLVDATWSTLPERPTVLVPLGSTEQHGPHLALGTDTTIASAVAENVAGRLPGDVLVAPPFHVGASGEQQGFPGLLSIGNEALELMLVEVIRSLSPWAGQVTVVNGHGGNTMALSKAITRMRHEGHRVDWLPCAVEEADLHAGNTETSLMLYLAPEAVDMGRAEAGNTGTLAELMPEMLRGGVAAVSGNGVLGDPTSASVAQGKRLFEQMVEGAVDRLLGRQVDERGCLTGPVAAIAGDVS